MICPRCRRASAWLAAIVLALVAVPVWACSVPVFRYALERWESDAYEVVVFHRGPLSESEAALASKFDTKDATGAMTANVSVQTVDLDAEPDEQMLKLWEAQQTDTLPWMALRYPVPLPDAWAGPFSEQNVDRVLNSPLRQEIARRILKGETAVWVFLESGDEQADRAAFKMLEVQLPIAQLQLELPEIDEQDVADGLVSIEPDQLKISFSLVSLSRDDPAEKMFVEMLLGSEGAGADSLRDPELTNRPMAFPVFGRGRVLYALVGGGINEENILAGCRELIGPCTCQVKDQNPGTDLLMSIDWDRLVQSNIEIDKELPPLSGIADFAVAGYSETPLVDPSEPAGQSPSGNGTAATDGNSTTAETSVDVSDQDETTTALPAGQPIDETASGGMNSVIRNTIILVGVSVVGIFVASFLFVGKRE